MEIYVKKFFDYHIFSFLFFSRDFIKYIDFTHIAASKHSNS